MATEHENWLEKGEIYALGALDGQELREFEAHLAAGCAVCEAYIRETREVLTVLHRSLPSVTPPPSVKALLADQIAREKVVPLAPPPRAGWRRWQVITGTLAAGILGAVLAGALVTKRYEPHHTAYTAVVDATRPRAILPWWAPGRRRKPPVAASGTNPAKAISS
jgi:anti-sigma-K factor RskA